MDRNKDIVGGRGREREMDAWMDKWMDEWTDGQLYYINRSIIYERERERERERGNG